jgi:hypothetical protein
MNKYILLGLMLVPYLSHAMDKDDGIGLTPYNGSLPVKYLRKEDVSKVDRHENDVFVYYEAIKKNGDCEIIGTYLKKNKEYRATYSSSYIGIMARKSDSGLISTLSLQNAATIFKKLQEWHDQQSK